MNNLKETIKDRFPSSAGIYRKMRRLLGFHENHWVREVMDLETLKLVKNMHHPQMSALEISGNKWGTLNMFERYKSVDYPEFDVCTGPLDECFDLIDVVDEQQTKSDTRSRTDHPQQQPVCQEDRHHTV